MKPLLKLWNERYGVNCPLEVDSWSKHLVNTHIVATLMNVFPRLVTKIFSRSRGELAQRLFRAREGGSYRVLRAMYRFEEPHNKGDLLNRILMQSPAVKAARNRRKIAQWMLETCLRSMPAGPPRLVMTIGGGDAMLEAEVIAKMEQKNIYYFGVDMDAKAVDDNRQVFEEHGLDGRGFTHTGSITQVDDIDNVLRLAGERFGVEFDGLSVTICQGLIEYIDMHSDSNENLLKMLRAIHSRTREDGSLLISQTGHHDRVTYLEKGLEWYMRLRESDEVAQVLEEAGWKISICDQEPMQQITMCLATKAGIEGWRLDAESPLRQPHIARHAVAKVR
ncbi:MAG: hypothetical protein PVH19_09035 [Planctomycetia bacterium]|jgi:hypothetical protein